MDAIKLQVLLKRPVTHSEMTEIRQHLSELGMDITGQGTITLSAVIPEQRFEEAFSKRFKGTSGFLDSPEATTTLRIPENLQDYIESITETPRHIRMARAKAGDKL